MMGWKIDLRWHDGRLDERTETADSGLAVDAFRALLRRDDLGGQPVAARMVSPSTRKSIYFSRFDGEPGAMRIHPDAPIDPFADGDMTAEAAAWRPVSAASHDWAADVRSLSDCLKDWHGRHGWKRDRAAAELAVPRSTYDGWCAGRPCALEGAIRRLMTLIDAARAEP